MPCPAWPRVKAWYRVPVSAADVARVESVKNVTTVYTAASNCLTRAPNVTPLTNTAFVSFTVSPIRLRVCDSRADEAADWPDRPRCCCLRLSRRESFFAFFASGSSNSDVEGAFVDGAAVVVVGVGANIVVGLLLGNIDDGG